MYNQKVLDKPITYITINILWLYVIPIVPFIIVLTIAKLWTQELLAFAAAWSFVICTSSLTLITKLYKNAIRSDKAEPTTMMILAFYLISASVIVSLTAASVALFIEFTGRYLGHQTFDFLNEPSIFILALNSALILLSSFITLTNKVDFYE